MSCAAKWAGIAQLVERDLAKVEAVGSSPIYRSKIITTMGPGAIVLLTSLGWGFMFWLMGKTGYGKGYKYDHNFEGAVAGQTYLPEKLAGRKYYFHP